MLLEGRHPAATLDGLDLFAASLEGAYCATVVCAIFDREDAVVTYARAGHPPPLVVNAAGTMWLEHGGAPLAVTNRQIRKNATVQLSGDDVIILYSDGLIERRGETLDDGFDRLACAATELFGSAVQPFADGLIKRLLPEHATDDVVLVVKKLTIIGPPSDRHLTAI
ncbi:MAG: PP2C family protein-serine/threonine phosphatase [Ilumatobacteraceae bacterium]